MVSTVPSASKTAGVEANAIWMAFLTFGGCHAADMIEL